MFSNDIANAVNAQFIREEHKSSVMLVTLSYFAVLSIYTIKNLCLDDIFLFQASAAVDVDCNGNVFRNAKSKTTIIAMSCRLQFDR